MQSAVRKFIAICTPTLGSVSANWALQYGSIIIPMNMSSSRSFVWGKPVAEARNQLVADVLKHHKPGEMELSHIFWLDDDVLAPAYSLLQLLSRKVPICSGVYYTKSEFPEPLIFDGPGAGSVPFVPNQFREVYCHGQGLTLVAREVYERVRDECDIGTDDFGCPAWYKTRRHEPMQSDDPGCEEISVGSQTEDFHFLGLCHDIGYKTYVDTTPYGFGWHYCRHRQVAYPFDKWHEYVTTGKVTWPAEDGGEPVVWDRSLTAPRPENAPKKIVNLGIIP